MKENEKKLRQVMADAFGVKPEVITEEASVDTIKSWDSLHQMKLVLGLESAFDLSLTEQESVEILSYPLIVAVLREHGVEL